ncbi:chondroitin AC/alginate lyase [Auriscalpium vulgare]|uniref:Chondroitin AC/alginate lyase n=1 Tax=Auriscalpium vulgare TaxID=40419 RepID=A0ACB8RWE6_9AGAM|nr:chondroitin AC/alginate lyase [Auriscalpium vulgare]
MRRHAAVVLAFVLAHSSRADPNDWVNTRYVISQGKQGDVSTSAARQTIQGGASANAKGGPWAITNNNGALPPSRNPHDYLSWAPYHWPDCNWCNSKGSTNIVAPGNGADGDSDEFDPSEPDYYDDGGDWGNYAADNDTSANAAIQDVVPSRMVRVRREAFQVQDASSSATAHAFRVATPVSVLPSLPTPAPSVASTSARNAQSPDTVYNTVIEAEAPALTEQGCTPSPTRALAASATWTTCPYVVRDGKVNPDVRTLTDGPSLTHMTQAALYDAFAFALSGARTASYQQEAASVLETFFITPATAMHPNMQFAQIVRGPGPSGQIGTFTGVLDMRGLVRMINAVMVLKTVGASAWSAQRDAAFKSWVSSYVSWLEKNPAAQKAAGSPNNHGTFFVNQLASAKYLLGDRQGAVDALKGYFGRQFLDQIAASGEQPFEGVRTRPFHYRAFNLEAMITNAKLGDELGLDFWTAKSKYGATIQTAVNFLISVDPKGEDPLDAVPHVAAVAAAYGDPTGRYKAYLTRVQSNYRSRPYWFYDQSAALPTSPAGKRLRTTSVTAQQQFNLTGFSDSDTDGDVDAPFTDPTGRNASGQTDAPTVPLKFECPAVFDDGPVVEVDDGIFVTCNELEPLYKVGLSTGSIL